MKEKTVVDYYLICNRLKDTIRTGWQDWNVSKERIESVAEHVYSTCMLALAMKSEYEYDIDIMKVIYMLTIHELGETVIGDLTMFDISKEEKRKIEYEAVHQVLEPLVDGQYIERLFLEFDEHKTKESLFAFQCDKLECDLQSKIYDEEGYVDLSKQENNKSFYDEDVQKLLKQGMTFGQMWMTFGQERYNYDDNFKAVSNYALNNKITEEK